MKGKRSNYAAEPTAKPWWATPNAMGPSITGHFAQFNHRCLSSLLVAVRTAVQGFSQPSALSDNTLFDRWVELLGFLGWFRELGLREPLAQAQSTEKSEFLFQLNAWRRMSCVKPLRSLQSDEAQRELWYLLETGARRMADALSKQLPPSVKVTTVRALLLAPRFMAISKATDLVDECLDRLLGLNEGIVKATLHHGRAERLRYRREEIYLDSPSEDLFTPYRVLHDILHTLRPKDGQLFVDLGSGLGRVGIVVGLLHPKLRFLGFELVRPRYQQAVNCSRELFGQRSKVHFKCENLSRGGVIPQADYYYLFNPFSRATLCQLISDLKRLGGSVRFRVIVARIGRPPRFIRRQGWLRTRFRSKGDPTWRGTGYIVYSTPPSCRTACET